MHEWGQVNIVNIFRNFSIMKYNTLLKVSKHNKKYLLSL